MPELSRSCGKDRTVAPTWQGRGVSSLMMVGLSVLLGMGVGTVLPARTAQAGDAIESGGATNRADEMEAPRWGDAGTEKGEMEAPWGSR